jgi:hypothetical protein
MITDILIQLLSTLIEKGFELPIYIFVVSQNGNVVAARYEGNPSKEKPKVISSWSISKIPTGNCL